MKNKVLSVLKDAELTVNEIAVSISAKKVPVQLLLGRLLREGIIKQDNKDKYRLA
jgi:DNA-binding IclR family transcriptional regulator